jgi:hypothetical protein
MDSQAVFFCLFFFETGSCYVAEAGLELAECWDYKREPLHLPKLHVFIALWTAMMSMMKCQDPFKYDFLYILAVVEFELRA